MDPIFTKTSKRNFLGLLATVAAAGWYYQSSGEWSPSSSEDSLTTSYDASAIYDSIIRKRTKDELPTPPEETPAFAITDAGAYEWPAEGTEWHKLPLGTKDDPLAPIRTIHERIKERSVFGHALDDFAAGRVSDTRWASWPMQMPKHLASYPVNKSTPVLMFHSEGSYPAEYTETFPRMKKRGIPWMMAATPDRIGTGLERSQLIEMMMHGCEVGLYTADGGHLDEHVDDLGDLEQILLDQKRALEQMGFPIQHMMPRKGSGINTSQIDSAKSYMTRTAFTASGHGYAAPVSDGPRAVGNVAHHGAASIKIEDDDMTAAEAKRIIDRLTKTTDRLRFFFHTHNIEDWNRMETILDYATQKRAAGDLDLATSTGGLLIPWDLPDGNIVNDSDASFASSWENGVWGPYGAPPVVRTDGGKTGSNYWAMGSDISGKRTNGLSERRVTLAPIFPAGMLDFYAKAPTGRTATVRTRVDSFMTDDLADKTFDTSWDVGDTWTRIYAPFGCPRADIGTDHDGGWRLAIWTTSHEVHVDDIRLYPC